MKKKKIPLKKLKKKSFKSKNIIHFLKRYFISVFSVFLITLVASLILTVPKPRIACANSISCIKDLSVNVQNNAVGVFQGHKVIPPKIFLSLNNNIAVLGASTIDTQKHIYVDLTNQTLYAYDGKTLFMKTFISSGKWGPTPTGNFKIWIKLRATRMTGGTGQDFYDLPNVPYVMYFYNDQIPKSDGFALHGAYWHNNFGNPMSHGCINLRIEDAHKLYDWADPLTSGDSTYATSDNPGTEVTIYGSPPI